MNFLKKTMTSVCAGVGILSLSAFTLFTSGVDSESEEEVQVNSTSLTIERVEDTSSDEVIISNNTLDFDRLSFQTASFEPEVVEDNLHVSWDELHDLQEEWEEEQERIAEEEAERERLEEEQAEREKQEREERERLEEEREQRELEEREREQERIESQSSSSSSDSSDNDESDYSNTPISGDGYGGWESYLVKYFGEDQLSKAGSVMMCESEGNPKAQNPVSTASGIFQFLDTTWDSAKQHVDGASQYDRAKDAPAELQIAVAADHLERTSWSQWVCQ